LFRGLSIRFYPLDNCRPIVYNSIIGFFIFGGLAHLVERNTCTVEVAGSIPVSSRENKIIWGPAKARELGQSVKLVAYA
jgi:hypothetical protein